MSSFITQHNSTDVTSFEGAFNWHADCRNVHQSCCHELNVHFSTISRLQRTFQRNCLFLFLFLFIVRIYLPTAANEWEASHIQRKSFTFALQNKVDNDNDRDWGLNLVRRLFSHPIVLLRKTRLTNIFFLCSHFLKHYFFKMSRCLFSGLLQMFKIGENNWNVTFWKFSEHSETCRNSNI